MLIVPALIRFQSTKSVGKKVERRLVALIIIIIVSVTIIGTVAYYALQPSEHYHSLLMFQWEPPPMTNTTAPFTTNGKQWYVEWTFVSYYLVSSSLGVSVRDASTNALVDQANLTNQQPRHYFNERGKFYLTIKVDNATNLEGGQLVLVDVWELG
jgi:hypothetical protein